MKSKNTTYLRMALIAIVCGLTFYVVRYRQGMIDEWSFWAVNVVIRAEEKLTHPFVQWRERRLVRQAKVEQLIEEREALTNYIHEMEGELIELRTLVSLANDIRELSVFRDRCYKNNGRIVRVILKQFSSYEHFFFIDAGALDNVVRDMVVVSRNCLVGRVVEVYPHFSKIAIITDKSCNVAGYCFKTQARGIYTGENSKDRASFRYVSHMEKVKEGDMIISSGEGLIYPPGLGLGTVEAAKIEGVEYQIVVKPLIDPFALNYVILLQQ
jgi:rod shape-determining protein MreC